MKVFVTGATGVMGRSVIHALQGAGHEGRALARSDESAATLAERGVASVRASLFDRAGLVKAMEGCDAVANLATHMPVGTSGLRPGAWKSNDRIHVEGSRSVAQAAAVPAAPAVRPAIRERAGERGGRSCAAPAGHHARGQPGRHGGATDPVGGDGDWHRRARWRVVAQAAHRVVAPAVDVPTGHGAGCARAGSAGSPARAPPPRPAPGSPPRRRW